MSRFHKRLSVPEEYSDPFTIGKQKLADAKVFSVDGMLAVSFIEYDGFYLFNPQSESWTHKNGNFIDIFIPKGMSGKVFEKTDGSYSIYEICKGEGEFSFALSLGSSERKRICAVSVTASFGVNSELVLTDKNKNELMKINGLYDETVTRTCIMNNVYADGGTIFFKGKGNVTVYGVRVEYKTIHNRLKNIL